MRVDDVEVADRVMRLAFGTIRRLPEPSAAFEDRDLVRTRFRAAPECAWVAETGGKVVGSVLAARWGSFGFLGPLTVHPELWDRGVGGWLLEPVLQAFEGWALRQAGLFTFADSPKHLGLYQKRGFWPGSLTIVATRRVSPTTTGSYLLASRDRGERTAHVLAEIRELTDRVFPGLDVEREVVAAAEQKLGDTLLVLRDGALEGVAVCHVGPGSEAGSGNCFVKFGAALPGEGAGERFERLLDACEEYAGERGVGCLVAGMDTGRLDAYRRLLGRGFRAQQIGLAMWLRPEEPRLDAAADYVITDLR